MGWIEKVDTMHITLALKALCEKVLPFSHFSLWLDSTSVSLFLPLPLSHTHTHAHTH